MRAALMMVLVTVVCGCASTPAPTAADASRRLLHDELFHLQPTLGPEQILGLSPEMDAFLQHLTPKAFVDGRREALLAAVMRKGQLKLEFDGETTRTAAEAFHDQSGNCLSLTLMVGAMARALGLQYAYQRVTTEATWSRIGSTYLAIGHVNLSLEATNRLVRYPASTAQDITIDFVPTVGSYGRQTEPISQDTVLAMFMNNRAVEALVRGDQDLAYSWARAAIHQDAQLADAYMTLGVIYERAGAAREAEEAFKFLLLREPRNTLAMSDLLTVYIKNGRQADALALEERLHQIEPQPPYYFFNLGQQALEAGDWAKARDWFAREVERAPYNDEFHFWLARAELMLGERAAAKEQLQLAAETSTTRKAYDLYSMKLVRLSESGVPASTPQ